MSADYGAYGYYGNSAMPPPAVNAAPIPTSVSYYGEQRPTFSDDGSGTPYSTILNLVGTAPSVNNDISYDTSSKDPHMIRARVFIGNLGRAIISRDDIIDLFRPFGKLIAVNFFANNGFGFVQFNEAAHADQACLTLHGTQWKSCCLDVHLAMLGTLNKKSGGGDGGKKGFALPSVPSSVPGKQTGQADAPAAQSEKRKYEEEEYEIFKQNKRNKQVASGDKTVNEDLSPSEMCDTMVCGNCRFVTSDFEEFKEHRITGCKKFKEPEEPRHRLKCATCNQRFLGAWGLLEHLTEFHRMLLYSEEKIQKTEVSQGSESASNSQGSSEEPSAPASASHEISAEPVIFETAAVSNNGESTSNQGTPQI